MRKVFTLLLMSIITSIGVWAEEGATASANFIVSDGGKTLTVSGKGDLTTLNMTITTTKFTNAAVGNVFVQNGESSYASVAEGAEFSATGTYYKEVPGEKTQIENTSENPFLENSMYVSSKSVIASWNEAKLNETPLYLCQKNKADNGFTWIDSATKVNAEDIYTADDVLYVYAIKSTSDKYDLKKWGENDNHEYYLEVKGNDLEAYLNKTTTFTAAQTIYVSTDGGKSLTKIEAGATATYNAEAQYYKVASSTYESYSNDLSEGQTLKELFASKSYTEDVESDSKAFLDLLNAKILEGATESGGNITGSYEKVVFVNEYSSTPLIINDDIVHAILFPKYKWEYYEGNVKNMSIVTLDLGEATIADLTSATFKSAKGMGNMTNLTLPLTKQTSVYSESEKANVYKMVVPSKILDGYANEVILNSVTIPEGYDRLADNAFNGNNKITTFNLPSTLKLIGNSAFENCVALASITLNAGLENIGKHAFVGTALTKIDFPSSLRIINDAAFANLRIEDLKFNAGLYYIGNTAFGLNNAIKGLKSIQIPASVKFIGACAFYGREYQDVYFLGENAPIMPMGGSVEFNDADKTNTAFPANTLNGNNGFHPGTQGQMPTADNMMDDAHNGYANRENYKNQGYYFAILHFPTGLADEQRAKYTDITRVYRTHRDEKGNFWYAISGEGTYDEVGKETETLKHGLCTASTQVAYGYEDTYLGSQYIWPSQSQWNRSYAVNSNGFNWDGVTEYRPELSEEDMQVLKYAGYNLATEEHPSTEEGYYTLDELQKIAHMGTRQFVLTNADTQKDDTPEKEPEYPISVKGSNWWTICVPFNMTKAQVDEVFGTGTHVCRFSSVKRTEDSNGKNITLCFQNDVYATKWTRNPENLAYNKESGGPADDDIVIYSHEAYMIYPTKREEDAITLVRKDYNFEAGSPLPTIIKANADDKTVGADHTEYRFVGNYLTEVASSDAASEASVDEGVATAAYETVTIPQYSYIYATKKGYAAYKFWFFTGTDMAWSPNKCVVQATARDGGADDYKNFFGGNVNGSKVSQVSLFGEDGTVTEIENVTIIAGEGENAQIVYNLNGQVVSSNGNTDRLAKGVYIKGGKKFMVK